MDPILVFTYIVVTVILGIMVFVNWGILNGGLRGLFDSK